MVQRRIKRPKAAILLISVVISLLMFILLTAPAKPLEASSVGEVAVVDLLPDHDAEVDEGYPDSTTHNTTDANYNFWVGYNAHDGVAGGGGGYLKSRAYLKWDLSGLAGATIENAFLRLYNKYAPSNGEYTFNNTKWMTVDAVEISDDDWLENEITWNNAPPPLDTIDSVYIDSAFGDPGDYSVGEWPWWSWDVTSWVQDQMVLDGIVSIVLKGQVEAEDNVVWFYSKDAYPTQPQVHLRINYSGYGVQVSIKPEYLDGYPGGTLVYTVTFKNVGTYTDTYILSYIDTTGWNPTLSSDLLQNVGIGEERQVKLTVTIPPDAALGTEDVITVTATSQGNTELSDSASCTGHAAERISPTDDTAVHEDRADQSFGGWSAVWVGRYSYQEGPLGPERAFLKFNLEGISPTIVIGGVKLGLYNYVAPDIDVQVYSIENDNWDEDAVTWDDQPAMKNLLDTKRVSDEDKYYYWDVTDFVLDELAGDNVVSFGLLDPTENAASEKSATFDSKEYDDHSKWPYLMIVPPYDVDVSISPRLQDNSPGGTLTYTVTVKNTGAYDDTYNLTVSDNASPNWSPSVSPTSLTVPHEENRTATLTVTIPSNAPVSTRDNMTVTATSTGDAVVSDSASTVAYAFMGVELSPIADTDVTSGYPGANHGSEDNLYIQSHTENYKNENIYLKFDLSEIPAGQTIGTAEIWLWSWSAKYADIDAQCREVTNDAWLENGLMWGSAIYLPGDLISTTTLKEGVTGWYSWNVTPFVIEQRGIDNIVSFCIGAAVPDQSGRYIFDSKEWFDNTKWPRLKVAGVPLGVDVLIYPGSQENAPGGTLEYTVTVKNTSSIGATYNLTVSDNENWAPTLSDNLLGVPAGENRQTTLSVTIPEDAEHCTRNNITVTATSQADDTVYAEDSCIAHAVFVTALGVDVSISPGEKEGTPGGNVTFTVTVTNIGDVEDNYDLSASNTGGWTLSLPSSVGPLENGTSDEVTLTVTIPSTAGHGDSTTVTVTATSQENADVSASDTCTARAVIGGEVEVTIDPTTKSGSAGEELTYFVTVTNTGAIADSYTLTVTDTNWSPTLAVTTTPTLDPGASRSGIRLTVTIPEDVAEGDSTTVTVTATGTYSENSAACTAKAAAAGISSLVYVGAAVVIVVIIVVVLIRKPF